MQFEYPFVFIGIFVYLFCKFYCRKNSLKIIFPTTQFFSSKYRFDILEFLVVLFLFIALASPVKIKIINTHKKGYDIVMVLDTSGSMAEANKLQDAKAIIADFAKKRKTDRLGLVIFGNIAYIASPLTFDKKKFNEILKRVDVAIAGGKTAIYDGLFLSSTLFNNQKKKIMILLTDGMDNMSMTPLNVVLQTLKEKHIKVYTIGLGNDVNGAVLKKIAKSTGGKFFLAYSKNDLKKVYDAINQNEKIDIKGSILIDKKYYFEYPLLIAILLFLIYLRRRAWSF